ncbi:MAG: lipid-A-disaccharide synthase, partial [Candidatus Sericytochromatia bacterium]|nr:lipid-A-disaccharide synthase [Candidatus Tanganyikabacteria bacterium]
MQADIIIISNAPGELAAWVRPVVGDLRKRHPEARITVALVPCPYASGR